MRKGWSMIIVVETVDCKVGIVDGVALSEIKEADKIKYLRVVIIIIVVAFCINPFRRLELFHARQLVDCHSVEVQSGNLRGKLGCN